jgi:maltose alpha-D-glucosyltransferase / alpha-amylase
MSAPQLDTRFLDRLGDAFATQLPGFLPQQRWFGAKARQIHSVQLADCIPVQLTRATALIALARIEYAEGPGDTYVLPLLRHEESAASSGMASSCIVRVADPESSTEILLTDALGDKEFLSAILDSIRMSAFHPGAQGELQATSTSTFARIHPAPAASLSARQLSAEQSNTSILYGERFILKLFRRVEEGINPELEIVQFLTEAAHFANTPPLCGSLEYRTREGKSMTLGILQGFVPNRGDAWRSTMESLSGFLALALRTWKDGGFSAEDRTVTFADKNLPRELSEYLTNQLEFVGLLGKRTAELHLALASSPADAAFAPERFTPEVCEELETTLHDLAVRNFDLLRMRSRELPEPLRQAASEVLKLEDGVLLTFHSALEKEIHAMRTRIHGDYHLGQVLFTGSDFFIIDFEGEPAKPVSERRTKRSPLQDVAGMLRSFHYAAQSAVMAAKGQVGEKADYGLVLERLAAHWQSLASRRFLLDYRKTAGSAAFLPENPLEFDALLRLHLLEKAIYELGYELNHRPDWLGIPLGGIEELVSAKP